jgi:regulatory protein
VTTKNGTRTVARVLPGPTTRFVRVVFDDGGVLVVPKRVTAAAGTAPGMTLLPAAIAELRAAEASAALTSAVRRLASSDRTEREIREYLRQGGYSPEAIENAIERLMEQRAIDDRRSAEHHIMARRAGRPRSRRMLRADLARRGVSAATADELTQDIDDAAGAHRVASRRAAKAPGDSYEAFARYLGPRLMRDGYGYDVAQAAIREAWKARNEAGPDG